VIRVIDIIRQKGWAAAPFKAEKGGLNPVYAKKIGVNAHFFIGNNKDP